ncbi:AMP-binding protein [Halorussus salilacus]|uniref:class I adenylate-forming enzyme family protein n=1 Tax=Halorussus salilacus TaxID=2953750 RepID=UPI0020A03B77|nr:AMP-binding protein [Halorussus salilacus]USZ69597.1 AMP-binding protein [Halorussus salilacus]
MTLSLERRADLWGDRTAVVDAGDDRRVSYADLDRLADRFAGALADRGVGERDAVAVVSRNRVELLALLFAARRLGAALAPVSHRLTPATVEGPLDVVDPALVVHEPAQRDLIREVGDEDARSFGELRAEAEGEPKGYERVDTDPERSLLYLHTKGRADVRGDDSDPDQVTAERVVDLPERAVEWNCITAVAAWGLGRGDCAPTLLPLSDTDGLHRLVLPLLYVGGRVVVLRAFDPERALGVVEDRGATHLFAGATEYRELVADGAFERTDFGGVEWFGTRSPLPTDAREALADRAPVVRAYGRVETGPNDLYLPAERASASADPDRVGRPFPDCEARIVGDADATVPEGEVGGLELRGPVTARGYVDGETFGEWVPTGDLAYREGGDYHVLGPTAEAAEGEGERIHPRTVERALEAHEGVTEAGAVVDSEGALAAVVGDADPGELRAFVADRLPERAVPREISVVESLPRRATGEPDRAEIRRQLGGEERFETE